MQVPEKLSLIGGSILLSSALLFTLKNQINSIIPSVGYSISNVFDYIGNAQKSSDFNHAFKLARNNGQDTGMWGTSKYYIDRDMNMHIGKGGLQGKLYDALGNHVANSVKAINFDQGVIAPKDSHQLLSGSNQIDNDPNHSITSINGLNNLDTNRVIDMYGMLANNSNLQNLDVSKLDTHNVTNMGSMFSGDNALSFLDVQNWNVAKLQDLSRAFSNDHVLNNLDLSHWYPQSLKNLSHTFERDYRLYDLNLSNFDTTHDVNMENMFINSDKGTSKLILGKNTYLSKPAGINGYGIWENLDNGQILNGDSLTNDNSHPGTWLWQK